MSRDHRITVTMISEALGLGKSFVHQIFTENLEMEKVSAKVVLMLLTPEQKLQLKEPCFDWKTSDDSNKFLQRAVTGDKTEMYDYNIGLKSQSKVWKKNEPRSKKVGKNKATFRVM